MNPVHDAAMNFNKSIAMLLLAVYLIVVGIVGLTGMGPGVLLPILALVAGVFILFRRIGGEDDSAGCGAPGIGHQNRRLRSSGSQCQFRSSGAASA